MLIKRKQKHKKFKENTFIPLAYLKLTYENHKVTSQKIVEYMNTCIQIDKIPYWLKYKINYNNAEYGARILYPGIKQTYKSHPYTNYIGSVDKLTG